MKSTIDLAKEAGMKVHDQDKPYMDLLETFRALCVAEEHKRLLGVGMEPKYWWEPGESLAKCLVPPEGAWSTDTGPCPGWIVTAYYTIEQLAAARLQGAEEERSKLNLARQRIAELEQQLEEVSGYAHQYREERDEFGHGLTAILERAGEDSTVGSVIAMLEQERSKVAVVKPGYDAAPSIEWLCNPADLVGKELYAGEQG